MKYIDADRIRAEIRRLYAEDSDRHIVRTSLEALSNLMDFLDTLEEQECPEYCVRSHCIGCSKYNSDEWSNKPRKARVKATGEIVEGFTDGQGHFDVFTDHNICNRYDVSAVEFDTIKEPVSEDVEEEISTWIPAHISGGNDEVWRDTKNVVTEWAGIVARHFAEWMKAKMMEGAVEEEVQEVYQDDDGIHCCVSVGTDYNPGTIVYVITIPKEGEQ